MTRVSLPALLLGLAACGGDDDRPPPLEARAGPHPASCAEIQDGVVTDEGRIVVAGLEAACAADGLMCPLPGAGSCDGGRLLARCSGRRWTASCASQ